MDKDEFNKEYFEGKIKSHYKSYEEMEKIYFPKSIIEEKIPEGAKVLDIGCAYGYFIEMCDKYDLDTYGVDISEYSIKRASKITKAKLFIHDVNEGLPVFDNDSFDLVTIFDIIEHVESPHKFLREVHRVLKTNGKIIITTPNLNAIQKLWKRSEWFGYQDKTHIYLFMPSSLRFTVERAGFNVQKVETPFHCLPFFLSHILSKTKLGGQIWLVGMK